mgnify:CR=1 FL=1
MENFYFGIEDHCRVVFHGTEEDNERFEWFANNKRVLLKNGFGLKSIIEESEEIFNIENEPKYFELILSFLFEVPCLTEHRYYYLKILEVIL